MKNPTFAITLMCLSALTLIGCQTVLDTALTPIDTPAQTVVNNQLAKDSDSDGVPDDLDQCPATPYKVVVDENGCPFAPIGIGLKMEYRAFFAKGSSELSKEYQLELDKVANKLKEYETATMRIEGHASVDETSDTKLHSKFLSNNRALIVKNYLIMHHQIDPDRLSTFSYGTERPIAPSDTKEDKSINRRVYGIAMEPQD